MMMSVVLTPVPPAVLHIAGSRASVVLLMSPAPPVSFVAEGSGVVVTTEPPVNAKSLFTKGENSDDPSPNINVNTLVGTAHIASSVSFVVTLAEQLQVTWETLLTNGKLYVEVPAGILPEGSKQSLVTLLEYAEEKLHCGHVILCFRKNRTDKGLIG